MFVVACLPDTEQLGLKSITSYFADKYGQLLFGSHPDGSTASSSATKMASKPVAMETDEKPLPDEVIMRDTSVEQVEMMEIEHPSANTETTTDDTMETDSGDNAKKSEGIKGLLIDSHSLVQNNGNEKNGESEERKAALRLCKTGRWQLLYCRNYITFSCFS